MSQRARITIAISTGLLLTAAVAGCSSSSTSETSAATPAASGSMVGGTTTCDNATISAAIEESLTADGEGGTLTSLDNLECGDGWAAAEATVGDGGGNDVTETLVFQAEGQFWVPADRASVCGTIGDDGARPDDAQVPASIWDLACATN